MTAGRLSIESISLGLPSASRFRDLRICNTPTLTKRLLARRADATQLGAMSVSAESDSVTRTRYSTGWASSPSRITASTKQFTSIGMGSER
jgi:hypothetical protein